MARSVQLELQGRNAYQGNKYAAQSIDTDRYPCHFGKNDTAFNGKPVSFHVTHDHPAGFNYLGKPHRGRCISGFVECLPALCGVLAYVWYSEAGQEYLFTLPGLDHVRQRCHPGRSVLWIKRSSRANCTWFSNEDPRAADCVTLIKEYLDLSLTECPGSNYEKEFRDSVVELQNIALEHCEFLIAVRLREISRLLENVEKANVA